MRTIPSRACANLTILTILAERFKKNILRRKRIEKLVFQTLVEQVNIVLEAVVGIAFAHDLAVCVNDRRMVASSEQGADLRQALVGEFL